MVWTCLEELPEYLVHLNVEWEVLTPQIVDSPPLAKTTFKSSFSTDKLKLSTMETFGNLKLSKIFTAAWPEQTVQKKFPCRGGGSPNSKKWSHCYKALSEFYCLLCQGVTVYFSTLATPHTFTNWEFWWFQKIFLTLSTTFCMIFYFLHVFCF